VNTQSASQRNSAPENTNLLSQIQELSNAHSNSIGLTLNLNKMTAK
jgi:hypothetical protein